MFRTLWFTFRSRPVRLLVMLLLFLFRTRLGAMLVRRFRVMVRLLFLAVMLRVRIRRVRFWGMVRWCLRFLLFGWSRCGLGLVLVAPLGFRVRRRRFWARRCRRLVLLFPVCGLRVRIL